MRNFLRKIFKNKEKEVTLQKTTAKVIPIFNKEQEYNDLEENHSKFFNTELSPKEKMQPKIGDTKFSNIENVTPSRSQNFFLNDKESLLLLECKPNSAAAEEENDDNYVMEQHNDIY